MNFDIWRKYRLQKFYLKLRNFIRYSEKRLSDIKSKDLYSIYLKYFSYYYKKI